MKKVCLAAPHLYEERNEKITLDRFLNGEQAGDLEIVKFEKELSSYVGTRKALVLSSGTVAIRLALKSLGVKVGMSFSGHQLRILHLVKLYFL